MTLGIPERGGTHPTFRMYMEGRGIDSEYNLSKSQSYKFTAQLRNMKQAGIGERALMNTRDNSSIRNFNGNIEVSDSTSKTETDKEDFFEALKDKVAFYGLHNSFYLPSTDWTMMSLLTDSNAYSLKEVTTEFKYHLIEPDPVSINTNGTQVETRDSIQARCYALTEYEIYDISLSCLVVEFLLSSSFDMISKLDSPTFPV